MLLKNIQINKNHEVSSFFKALKETYGEKSDVYQSINNFYSSQIEIIKTFKIKNDITSIKELYEAFRYPENNEIRYDHSCLKYNGKKAIEQIEKIINQMDLININVNIEYEKE